ncbi:uncharacterized protein LOC6565006 isoform X2 [Drosophila grimshawi]|uniref:uncharacterized protein LOC6565006 isoform X2 n=1 Tax=Drosophila grimshawi TaxID=7222 RepID=UPI0013EF2C89|nr:uncharacterized protein LOC6565006 isoform X2 [Drosophila grimshawi]
MRRSRVNSASLASASASASIEAHTFLLKPHQQNIARLNRSPSPSLSQSQSLIWALAVVSIIASQVLCVLAASTTDSISTIGIKPNTSTENNFYFDEQYTTKSLSVSAADTAATTSDVSPMLDGIPTTTYKTQLGHIGLGSEASMRIEAESEWTANSTTVKNDSTAAAGVYLASTRPATATATATAMATTTKNVRSTIKQPIDSTRSRNHWNAGNSVDAERSRTFRSKYHHENHYGPFFEEPSNLIDPGKTLVSSVHLFTAAVLNCRVGMLKDKTVMWVRRTTEKVSLLTVGNVTYSGDPRISVKFQYPNNWRLIINPTHREDAGIYMCQVSTHPPRVFTTNLTILEPPLRIIDEHERDVGDRYYKSGSTVDLQCQISRNFFQKERHNITESSSSNSKLNDTASELYLISYANQTHSTFSSQELEKYFINFITWAKDEEPLQALTNRRFSVSDKWLNSRISIPDAKISDSGNYSCSLGRLFTVLVHVQVLTGELPAAVQHNLARRSAGCFLLSWSLIIIVICFHIYRSHSSQFHDIQIMIAN